MSRLRSRIFGAVSIAALALMAMGAVPVQAGSSGGVLMVDDDGQATAANCGASGPASNAAYSTIQSAIVASHSGDTILVCPGNYTENLVIRQNRDDLSLRSVKPFKAHIWRPVGLDGDIPLVHIKPGADGVSFVHFSLIFPTTDACDAASAAAILIEGTNASIRGNRIRSDGDDDFYTCGYANGIVVTANHTPCCTTTSGSTPADSSAPASALVGWNIVRDFQESGVIIGADTQGRVTRNSIHFGHLDSECSSSTSTASPFRPAGPGICAGFGIQYKDGARGTVDGNFVVSDAAYRRATSTAGITSNAILAVGIEVDGYSSGDVKVVHNFVALSFTGIVLFFTAGTIVEENFVVEIAGDGILVIEGFASKIRRNEVHQAAIVTGAGIHATDGTQDNVFRGNVATNNFYDCEDDTDASAANVDNTWVNNTGNNNIPTGLCTPEAP